MILREALESLKTAVGLIGLYEGDHLLVRKAIERLQDAIEGIDGESVISLFDGRVFFQRELRSHESLEFVDFIRSLEAKGVESLGFVPPTRTEDVEDLVAFLAGIGDPPVGGSIALNEANFVPDDEGQNQAAVFRARYLSAMDALRSAIYSVQTGENLDLTMTTWAVQGLLETAVDDPTAAILLSTLKSHDQYTFYHSVNVAVLSIALARAGGVPESMMEGIALGALLHDIGKAKVDNGLLNKPGTLDEGEWVEVRLHPQEGALAILGAAGPAQYLAAVVAFEHHAGFRRDGYPTYGGAPIPHPASRLVSVADVYDAVTTRRSYRRAETPTRAQLILRRGAGTQFDPDAVDLMHLVLTAYPIGSVIRLVGGEIAVVTSSRVSEDHVGCVIVKGRDGVALKEPEPTIVNVEHIADQLSPESADVQPAAYIEQLR